MNKNMKATNLNDINTIKKSFELLFKEYSTQMSTIEETTYLRP